MGRGIQAEVWPGSRRLRDAKADVEGLVRLVQERYTNERGGDLGFLTPRSPRTQRLIKKGILSGLCVRGFSASRAQGLIERKEYLAALADFA